MIQFNKTEFVPYIQISSKVPFEELKEYVSIEFTNWIWDSTVDGTDEDKAFSEVIPARLCEASDFPEDSGFDKVLEHDKEEQKMKLCIDDINDI